MSLPSQSLIPLTIVGRLPHQQYRVLSLLGRGGTAIVFKVKQLHSGQIYALKLMHADCKREAFKREKMLSAQMHHPQIVQYIDSGETSDAQFFLVFEMLEGESLKDRLIRRGQLSAVESADILGQVLQALIYLHSKGIVHRDLKPHNIMLCGTMTHRQVKLIDFGNAGVVTQAEANLHQQMQSTSHRCNETFCSPIYSAPEQIRGASPAVTMDIYAWGLLLLECLTGQAAIQGATIADVLQTQCSPAEVRLPPSLYGHPVAQLLWRVLRKDAQQRTRDASVLYRDLRNLKLQTLDARLHSHGLFAQSTQQTDLEITQVIMNQIHRLPLPASRQMIAESRCH
ncbi:serine/threonine protein kinase [Undibacterium seohonense]|uniref:Serine/threonine protein kinase n=1 Tax=Undibacterium seohonense TaxID=1344950 RepID=A0ABR6X7P6_9BURK|nr:serine/threonine-protein kinase [Undibacterium seohonense]MBC3808349.1 serine/threonine protein kinase [Undibacterium seohonense]